MASDVICRFPEIRDRVRVTPNYVDTERLRPNADVPPATDLIYVGRLTRQKNLENLLEAIRPLDATLTIVGDGPLRRPLRRRFCDLGDRVRWLGARPHGELPTLLSGARVFILPSHYEGHPKALIEAMAVGLPVIGGDSPGIRDQIRHGETGLLCGTEAADIRKAIRRVLRDADLAERLGRRARGLAVESFSLDRVVEMELAVLDEVLCNG
jgi:glycosyltransferase involved in cell wall biosynthesis